jgi:hypothetical protein
MLNHAGLGERLRGRWSGFSNVTVVPKLTLLVFLLGVIRVALQPAHVQHDVAMYLQAGQLLLRGQRPYVDFIDLNPPLITYLSAIPAAIAATLRVPIVPTALLLTLAAVAVSLATTRRTLLAMFEENRADPLVAEVIVLALAYALLLSDLPEALDLPYPGHPSPDPRLSAFFGQREHLFLIAAAPFAAVRLRRWEGGTPSRWGAVLAGTIAGVGTCIKPPFALVLLGLELFAFLSKRRLSAFRAPELGAVLVAALGYGLHFLFLPAAVKEAWFGRWLPFVLRGYGVFDEPSYGPLLARCWPAAAVFALVFALRLPEDPLGERTIRAFSTMALGGAALYVAQKKGWMYHAYPERALATVAFAGWVAGARPFAMMDDPRGARWVLRVSAERARRGAAVAVTLVGAAAALSLALLDTSKDLERLRQRSQIMRTIASFTNEGDPVLVATTSVWDPYPALTLLGRTPGSRYLWLFPIPMQKAASVPGADVEGDFVRELAEDIRGRRPKLLLLQKGRCYGCTKTSVEAFFHEHAPLDAALGDYSLRGTVRDGQELQVFVRKPAEP